MPRFLAKHTQSTAKEEGTKEWKRTTDIVAPAVEEYILQPPGTTRTPVGEDSIVENPLEKLPET